MALFKQVTIVGLGLMGGSLGMAIRRRRLAGCVVGLSRTARTLRLAKRRGAVDCGTTHAQEAVRDAELVVLATPVDQIIPSARRLARLMRPGAILTDVGSTKGSIARALTRRLPGQVAFVGAHPLAGSEQRGIATATAGLFEGSTCIVTKTRATDPRAVARVQALWNRLARRVVVMTPQRHDRLIAQVSHLPHVVAFCLMEAVQPDALSVAPRSFLEATRVAKSDPDLWDDILLSNRDAVLSAMDRVDGSLRCLRQALANRHHNALKRILRDAQTRRRVLPE